MDSNARTFAASCANLSDADAGHLPRAGDDGHAHSDCESDSERREAAKADGGADRAAKEAGVLDVE
jgi:hypothetical protein